MDVLFNNPQGVRRAVAAVLGLPLSQVKMGPHQTREGGDAGWPILAPIGSNPDPAVVAAWTPAPDPAPGENLTDVDKAIGNFKAARLAAPEALDKLKGTVWAALVAGGMTPDEATAAGVGLVLIHGPLLAAFEAAGGHPVAGQALYAAIASKPSTDALPWLTKGILEVFEAALVPK